MNKIMIVEDSEDIRGLLQNYLEKYGYQTVVAADFTAVLDVFLREKPDVVLLDINLPAYDGYYWCRQIRQHSTSPIIFISARSGEMDQVMAIENGGDDYIEKPFSYDIVLAKIKSQIRRAYGEYAAKQGEKVVEYAGVQLFVERFELRFQDEKSELSKKESKLACERTELPLPECPVPRTECSCQKQLLSGYRLHKTSSQELDADERNTYGDFSK